MSEHQTLLGCEAKTKDMYGFIWTLICAFVVGLLSVVGYVYAVDCSTRDLKAQMGGFTQTVIDNQHIIISQIEDLKKAKP